MSGREGEPVVLVLKQTSDLDELLMRSVSRDCIAVVQLIWSSDPNCQASRVGFATLTSSFKTEFQFAVIDLDQCRDDTLTSRFAVTKPNPLHVIYVNGLIFKRMSGRLDVSALTQSIESSLFHPFASRLKYLYHTERRQVLVATLSSLLDQALASRSSSPTSHHELSIAATSSDLSQIPGLAHALELCGYKKLNGSDDRFVCSRNDMKVDRIRLFCQMLQHETTSYKPPVLSNNPSLTARLLSHRTTVMQYLDEEFQALARSVIPVDRLASEVKSINNGSSRQLAFLTRLTRWFKEEFFTWSGNFKCKECQTPVQLSHTSNPTHAEKVSGWAKNVEVYACPQGHTPLRFPRYNKPSKLLETRQGRCGEWAICFAGLLSACRRRTDSPNELFWFNGVRLVVDWTDHVWCEVWIDDESFRRPSHFASPETGRWVHCDPCEASVDQPALYESGWGKKLTYCLAYTVPPTRFLCSGSLTDVIDVDQLDESGVDVQDVTWRYSKDWSETLRRRTAFNERDLADWLARLHLESNSCWHSIAAATAFSSSSLHKPSIGARLNYPPHSIDCILCELVTSCFLQTSGSTTTDGDLPGRQSGPMAWRLARGEAGRQQNASVWHEQSPILPSDGELDAGCFMLGYNSALDRYYRPYYHQKPSSSTSDKSGDCNKIDPLTADGWQSMTSRWCNIARKVEHDHHMTYLARQPDISTSQEGVIEWTLDLSRTNYEVDVVDLTVQMVCHSRESRCSVDLLCPPQVSQSSDGVTVDRNSLTVVESLQPGSSLLFKSTKARGARFLTVRGRLWTEDSGQLDRVAWQKSQLFRQKDDDDRLWPLQWKVKLRPIRSEEEASSGQPLANTMMTTQ